MLLPDAAHGMNTAPTATSPLRTVMSICWHECHQQLEMVWEWVGESRVAVRGESRAHFAGAMASSLYWRLPPIAAQPPFVDDIHLPK